MLTLNSAAFVDTIGLVEGLRQGLQTHLNIHPGRPIVLDGTGQTTLDHMLAGCDEMKLPLTRMAVVRYQDQLKTIAADAERRKAVAPPEMPPGMVVLPMQMQSLVERLGDIRSRMHDELTARLYLQVEPSAAQFYEQKTPVFGAEVAVKFPTLVYDIGEGGKCFALDLSTAATFHFIRCLEGGITAMSRSLNIPDPTKGSQRNWGMLLGEIKKAINAKWQAQAKLSADAKFYEEAHAALAAFTNPYRNATMHLDQKYTVDESRHIMYMVDGFLRKLASRMDEDGNLV